MFPATQGCAADLSRSNRLKKRALSEIAFPNAVLIFAWMIYGQRLISSAVRAAHVCARNILGRLERLRMNNKGNRIS